MAARGIQTICKNFFKNGESTISKSQYTHKMIELINLLERNKRINYTK